MMPGMPGLGGLPGGIPKLCDPAAMPDAATWQRYFGPGGTASYIEAKGFFWKAILLNPKASPAP